MERYINARNKINELKDVLKTQSLTEVAEYIDKLTEEETKIMLKMIVYEKGC